MRRTQPGPLRPVVDGTHFGRLPCLVGHRGVAFFGSRPARDDRASRIGFARVQVRPGDRQPRRQESVIGAAAGGTTMTDGPQRDRPAPTRLHPIDSAQGRSGRIVAEVLSPGFARNKLMLLSIHRKQEAYPRYNPRLRSWRASK